MKKPLLFLSLISMILIAAPQVSFAKKKYRYIKREHGVRVDVNLPGMQVMPSGGDLLNNWKLHFAYTYNWKGFLEVGPYFHVKTDDDAKWMLDGGLLVEWNIIKNRGKRALIPAVGLKLGADDITAATGDRYGHYGIPFSLKYFVAKRTPLIVTLEPYVEAKGFTSFDPFTLKINFTAGFEYYFDIY